VIVVAGEALVDLVVRADGAVDARLGGGPYNAARTLARLGAPTTFFGGLGRDRFGRLLGDALEAEGVALGYAAATTRALDAPDGAGRGIFAVHVGALGLVMEPIGAAIERLLLTDVPPGTLVMLDPNCRPGAIGDRAAYLARIERIAARADVVKASVEDIAYLHPGWPPSEAAAALLAAGSSLVLVTDGGRPARAFLPGATLTVEVPSVVVVDTIGAGDAFGGGFLAWWHANGLSRDDLRRPAPVRAAVQAAAAAAAVTCTRPGADPPTLAELRASNQWPALPPTGSVG